MKALFRERYGTPDVLTLRDVECPAPKADEVLLRVHAASVNDWDWVQLQGGSLFDRVLFGLLTPRVKILGCDVSGRVAAVGSQASRFKPGDEVYGDLCGSGFGGFAEYVCAPETSLATKPPHMTFEQAASIPQAGMLAVQGLLDVGRLRPGQKLLLNGAGGGVGTFALQIAKRLGVEVTVVDKPGKLEVLRAIGADHVVDFSREDFTRGDRRYDLILDVKTNRPPWAYARALNPGGTYVTVGGSMLRLLQALVLGPVISWLLEKRLRIVALKPNKDLGYFNELFEAGQLAPVIDGPYSLAAARDALRHFGTGQHIGKVVITMIAGPGPGPS
jgi:NADPH:quinone reductase-like Zn-dependent oxidoreductase